jgi:multidrug efflux pump subunit AcrB
MARVELLALGRRSTGRPSHQGLIRRRARDGTVRAAVRAIRTRVVNFDWNEMTKSMRIEVGPEKARQLGISP